MHPRTHDDVIGQPEDGGRGRGGSCLSLDTARRRRAAPLRAHAGVFPPAMRGGRSWSDDGGSISRCGQAKE